jgi:hypothetical protein
VCTKHRKSERISRSTSVYNCKILRVFREDSKFRKVNCGRRHIAVRAAFFINPRHRWVNVEQGGVLGRVKRRVWALRNSWKSHGWARGTPDDRRLARVTVGGFCMCILLYSIGLSCSVSRDNGVIGWQRARSHRVNVGSHFRRKYNFPTGVVGAGRTRKTPFD